MTVEDLTALTEELARVLRRSHTNLDRRLAQLEADFKAEAQARAGRVETGPVEHE